MAEVLLIVESAAKATYLISMGVAPPWKHDIVGLLADQPETVRQAFRTLAGSALDLAALHEWRKSSYVADRPALPDENELHEQWAAATTIRTPAVGVSAASSKMGLQSATRPRSIDVTSAS